MAERNVSVKLSANVSAYQAAMGKASASTAAFSSSSQASLTKVGGHADQVGGKVKGSVGSAFDTVKANAGLMAVGVVGAVGAMAAKTIEAASRLGESINAVNVTFGESAEGIKALGEEAAESVGLSNSAFNSLAVQFSSFAETVAGDGGDVVVTMDEMTTRIADFASVMNVDVAEAARIFQSGLAGETEPLRKFGIDLSAAAVNAHAYANGIAEAGDTLTESEKVQSRYSLLMKETAKTAGDFANTSDGLANSQRILAAKLEDTSAKVGEKLAPALAQVTTMLAAIIPVAGQMAVGVGKAFEKMADGAYAWGQTITEIVDHLPFVDIPGPIAETLYEQEKLARGTAALVAEYAKGAPTFAEFEAALQDQGLSQHAINLALIEYRKQLDGVNDSTGAAIPTTEELAAATDEVTVSTEMSTLAHFDAATAMEAREAAEEAAIQAAEDHAEAMDELAESYVENFEAANSWLSELGSAMDSAGGAISDFSDEALADIDTFQQELSDNVAALSGWQGNLITIASETSPEFAAYLAEMGLAGTELVEDLAGDTGELETTFEQWKFASAVAGRDMVAEFGKVSPEALAEFEALGHKVASTVEGMGTLTSEEAQSVGAAIAAGIALGIDINAGFIAASVATAAHFAIARAKEDIEASSPSRLFAREIGKPIAWGIAKGIDDEHQKLIDAAQDAAQKLVEGFEKEIESSKKDALDAVDDMVDEVTDRFDSMWDVVEGRRDLEGLTEGVADAELGLAEAHAEVAAAAAEFGHGSAEHLEALDKVEDAADKLANANYRLLKASQDLLDQGPAGVAAFTALAAAAGLEAGEIGNLVAAYAELQAARATATAERDQINAEAAGAQDVRARFGQAAASGLADDWIDHIAQFAHDPAFQLELMRQFLATLPSMASGGIVPGSYGQPTPIVAHGGEWIGYDNMTAGASYGDATTAVFNLTVHAGMGADGREIGDVILDKLAATVRRNGPGVLVKLTGG